MTSTDRRRGRPPAARAALATLLVVLAASLASCGGDSDGGGDTQDQAEAANKAYQRLDDTLTRNLQTSDSVLREPFACLNAAPSGGPELAKCARKCEKCAIDVHVLSKRTRSVYGSSPPYIKRIYRSTHGAAQRTFSLHGQSLDAMGRYARVHGASSYAGSAEFAQVKTLFDRADTAERLAERRLRQARKRWYRYAARRFDLQY
jgi:hypothetical protein